MNENMSIEYGGSPEEEDDGLTQEQREQAASWLPEYKEKEVIMPEKEREDCEQAVADLQGMFAAFEAEHPLEELYAITELAVEDARKYLKEPYVFTDLVTEAAKRHPVREPAHLALAPIRAKLRYIREKTNISAERYAELDVRYKYLSNAVGIINGSKVRHE